MDEKLQQNIENTELQMRKGSLEFSILLLIAARKKMYAFDILTELKKNQLIVVEGTLYPLLNRLRRENLLSYTWEESPSGPPRKYYTITSQGKLAIDHLATGWKKLHKSIHSLLKEYEKKH